MSRWVRSTDDENLQSVVKWGTQDMPRALRNPPYDGRLAEAAVRAVDVPPQHQQGDLLVVAVDVVAAGVPVLRHTRRHEDAHHRAAQGRVPVTAPAGTAAVPTASDALLTQAPTV